MSKLIFFIVRVQWLMANILAGEPSDTNINSICVCCTPVESPGPVASFSINIICFSHSLRVFVPFFFSCLFFIFPLYFVITYIMLASAGQAKNYKPHNKIDSEQSTSSVHVQCLWPLNVRLIKNHLENVFLFEPKERFLWHPSYSIIRVQRNTS